MRINLLIKKIKITSLILAISSTAFATNVWWKDKVVESNQRYFSVNFEQLKQTLLKVQKSSNTDAALTSHVFVIPMPNGQSESFKIIETPIMAPELAAKYPSIKTYTGYSIDRANSIIKIDIGEFGLHAMVINPEARYYIDPVNHLSKNEYKSYFRKDVEKKADFNCFTQESEDEKSLQERLDRLNQYYSNKSNSAPVTLRKYRLALACTGEYAVSSTGTSSPTKAQVFSRMVTSMNRVNGVYETEVAVTMEFIPNNDTLIFLNGSTDPYNNNDGFTMLGQNQTTVTSRIGNANYDIGHVFSTGGGGVASLGSVCVSNQKARGVTGSPNPIGDPFDIDYVAHEVGHQFDATHTFNSVTGSCGGGNRSDNTAYEPGSGTTIMAYAGICGADDIKSNSDPYFHTASLDQINAFISTSANACASKTPTNNNPPVVNAGADYIIPISTPFVLNGSATDPDNDNTLTYSWEQMDLGPGGAPQSTVGNSPLFRFFPPVNNGTRTFPKLNDILTGASVKGERLPNYSRSMKFRLTVRDNIPMAGATGFDEMNITVTSAAGPFNVALFNTVDTILSGSKETILWNVANTNLSPVNCTHVRILLSTDNGQTFPHVLADSTENDGYELVDIPNLTATSARIKVEAIGNIFFDINNATLRIVNPTGPDFSLNAIRSTVNSVCAPDSLVYSVTFNPIAGFSDSINLSVANVPAGTIASFSKQKIGVNETSFLTFKLNGATVGAKNFILIGNANTTYRNIPLSFTIAAPLSGAGSITVPNNGQINVNPFITFSWPQIANANAYRLQVSIDTNFSSFFIDTVIRGISTTTFNNPGGLLQGTKLFARIAGMNDCGQGTFSNTIRFTTASLPNAPSNLEAISVTTNAVTLRWVDNATNETSYRVERSIGSPDNFVIVGNLGQNATQYINTTVQQGNTYYYRIFCFNATGNSGYSNILEVPFFVGINQTLNFKEFLVFPNPANEQLNLKLEDQFKGKAELRIINELGKLVYSREIKKDKEEFESNINIKDFSRGIYFIQIISKEKSSILKFIKE